MAYASGQVTVLVQDGKPLNAVGKRLKKLAEEKLSQETNPETTHKMGIDVHGLVKASVRLSTQNKR